MNKKAAIIEDDQVSANIISSILEQNGFKADIYTSAESALNEFQEQLTLPKCEDLSGWYDLICLDIHLPQEDGISLLYTLRQLEEKIGKVGTEVTNVLVITGDDTLHTFHEANSLRVSGYISKPINKAQLEKELALLSSL